jgi:parallel beta-helix repeat protein
MDVISVSDSPPSVVIGGTASIPIEAGDEMQFVQTTTGQVLGTATVTSVSSTKSDPFSYYTLGLSSAVAGVVPDPNGTPPAALDSYYTGTTVFDLSLAGASTITNNTFNNYLMAMNIRSCNLDCNISNNTFYLTGNGVNLEADFLQLQGPVPNNVSIIGNKFYGGIISTLGAGPGPYAYQVLIGNFMATPTPDGAHIKEMPSSYKGPENITVSSNSFFDSDAESILITGAQNISLKNNTISASGKLPRQDTGGAGASVAEASGIRVNGLTVKDTRPQTKEALEIADTVPCGQYPEGISTSKVSFNGSTADAILDERKCGN